GPIRGARPHSRVLRRHRTCEFPLHPDTTHATGQRLFERLSGSADLRLRLRRVPRRGCLRAVLLALVRASRHACRRPDDAVRELLMQHFAFLLALAGCTDAVALGDACGDASLVARWALDDGAGSSAADSTAMHDDGMLCRFTASTPPCSAGAG